MPVVLATHWGDGGKGAAELAKIVVGLCEQPSKPAFVYEDADTLWDKINKIAKKVYRAAEVTADAKVRAQIKKLQEDGYGHYPVCVAKTQSSFSTDAAAAGRAGEPRGQRARGAARRRRRVRGDDLRRHHDHARAAEGALGEQDRPGRRQSRRAVLESAPCSKRSLTQAFWIGLLKIIGVNIILSGDNAVVIALAARSLPPKQQKQAIIWGSGAAIVMRVILTLFAVALLTLPWLKLVGSLLLFWIGVKLLIPEEGDDDIPANDQLLAAIKTILIADLVMSLDNVIAVAAAAGGSVMLLILGLAISIPLVIFGATLLLKLMERFPVIITIGAGLIGWVAGEMLVTDRALDGLADRPGRERSRTASRTSAAGTSSTSAGALGVVFVVALGSWIARNKQGEANAANS